LILVSVLLVVAEGLHLGSALGLQVFLCSQMNWNCAY